MHSIDEKSNRSTKNCKWLLCFFFVVVVLVGTFGDITCKQTHRGVHSSMTQRQTPPIQADTPRTQRQTPPSRQTPPGPRDRHPRRQTPPPLGRTPSGQTPPRLKSGRYASYWNAFLLSLFSFTVSWLVEQTRGYNLIPSTASWTVRRWCSTGLAPMVTTLTVP